MLISSDGIVNPLVNEGGNYDIYFIKDDEVTILPPVISDREVVMTIAEDGTTEIDFPFS